MLMMVVMSLYTVVDGIFVARLVGTDAFSAVNIVYPLLSMVIALGTMLGAGTAALVAKKLGEGRQREANENLSFIVLVASIAGAVISAVTWLFLDSIMYALGANEAIFAYCRDYAFPLLFFLPASILQLAFQNLFVANGKPTVGLIVTVIGGLANVVLDYVFIALCDMGIAGAAWATGIGFCIPAVYGLGYFTCKRTASLYFVKPSADWKALLKSVTNGSSEMVSALSTSVTTFLFNITMMRFAGPEGVAAIAILLYLDFVLVALNLGYSLGVAPLFSFNYGRKNEPGLRKLFRISVGFCACTGGAVTVGTMVFAGELAAIFTPRGSAVHTMSEFGLRVFAAGYLFKGFSIFASALFTAFSNGAVSALLSFMRTLVFLVASLLGLTALFGVDGVWFASPLAEALAFILSLAMVRIYRPVYRYA